MIVIDARSAGALLNLRELWQSRELLAFLAWRDIAVRYRQTLLGAAWALLEPLVSVIAFTLVFHGVAKIDSDPIPYPLYCFTAMLLWTFFGRALAGIAGSLVANAGLLTKAYFPRLALPLASLLAATVDLACASTVYVLLVVYYRVTPSVHILTLPAWVLLAALNALGVGLALAAINVRYRDVSRAVPFLVQMWMFATPVAYPLVSVPPHWLPFYTLNPMVGVIEGMRWALLPGYPLEPILLIPSLAGGAALLLGGLLCFGRCQRHLADIV